MAAIAAAGAVGNAEGIDIGSPGSRAYVAGDGVMECKRHCARSVRLGEELLAGPVVA
jgi:hypothetical protein